MPYFSTPRNVELSTYEYLKTQLQADWSGLTVLKSFTQAYDTGVNPPIVVIRLDSAIHDRLEIGTNTLLDTYSMVVDVFARSDGQRLDLAASVISKLKVGWTFNTYAHVSGSPEQIQATADGRVQVVQFTTDTSVRFAETVDVKDRFRHLITFDVRVL